MKRLLTALLTAPFVWLLVVPAALAQDPGYNVYTNDWAEVCEYDTDHEMPLPSDLVPYSENFYPDENYGGVDPFGISDSRGDAGDWWFMSFPEQLGGNYIGTNYYDFRFTEDPAEIPEGIETNCMWKPRFLMSAAPNSMTQFYTPTESWASRHVRFADVGFIYNTNWIFLYPLDYLLYIEWKFEVTWVRDDTYVEDVQILQGKIYGKGSGYVLEQIQPREGSHIQTVILYLEKGSINPVLDYIPLLPELIPPLEINLDRITFTGYEPQYTPTVTPTPTRPTGPTPTATPTGTPRPPLWQTPTVTPTPTGTPQAVATFPRQYGAAPTAIPGLVFPAWPAAPVFSAPATPAALAALPAIPTPNLPTVTPVALVWYTPAPLTVDTNPYTDTAPSPTPWGVTTQIMSLTTTISNAVPVDSTTAFTVATAPDTFAPDLPRPLANVGYTFQLLGTASGSGVAYNLNSWAALIGYSATLPIQFAKSLGALSEILGPFGLFLVWILSLFPFALSVRIYIFFKKLLITVINLIIKVVNFIGDLWDLIPGL